MIVFFVKMKTRKRGLLFFLFFTIPNKKTIARAATMDNPAPEIDASVKSLGIFLKNQHKSHSAQVYNFQSNYPNIQSKVETIYACESNWDTREGLPEEINGLDLSGGNHGCEKQDTESNRSRSPQ